RLLRRALIRAIPADAGRGVLLLQHRIQDYRGSLPVPSGIAQQQAQCIPAGLAHQIAATFRTGATRTSTRPACLARAARASHQLRVAIVEMVAQVHRLLKKLARIRIQRADGDVARGRMCSISSHQDYSRRNAPRSRHLFSFISTGYGGAWQGPDAASHQYSATRFEAELPGELCAPPCRIRSSPSASNASASRDQRSADLCAPHRLSEGWVAVSPLEKPLSRASAERESRERRICCCFGDSPGLQSRHNTPR